VIFQFQFILVIFPIPKRNLGMDSTPAAKRRRQSKNDEIESSTPLKQLSPVVIFAHGAGAPSSSDWMLRFHFLYSFI